MSTTRHRLNVRQIQVIDIDPNEEEVYGVGDIHGTYGILEATLVLALDNAKTNDKRQTIISVGDLLDRNPDNMEIVRRMLASRANTNPAEPRFLAIRGNHEEMALRSIKILMEFLVAIRREYDIFDDKQFADLITPHLAKSLKKHNDNNAYNLNTVRNYISAGNGGKWLIDLFLKELESGLISVKPAKNKKSYQVQFDAKSDVKAVKELIEELPYMIFVRLGKGHLNFIFAHSSVPISDGAMIDLINTGGELNDEQINYLLWAREHADGNDVAIKESHRDEFSINAVVGHNIIFRGNSSVRSDAATINLDGGSYDTAYAPIMNLVTLRVCLISTKGVRVVIDTSYARDGDSDDDNDIQADIDRIIKGLTPHWHRENDKLKKTAEGVVLINYHLASLRKIQEDFLMPIARATTAIQADAIIREYAVKCAVQDENDATLLDYKRLLTIAVHNNALSKTMCKDLVKFLTAAAKGKDKADPTLFGSSSQKKNKRTLDDLVSILTPVITRHRATPSRSLSDSE